MIMGRPPTDLKELASDLLEWATNPTAFNLIQFARPRKINVTSLPDYAAKDKDFSEALQLAKQSIAMNRFEAGVDGLLPFSEVHRGEHNYDPLAKANAREEKEYDLSLELRKLKYASDLKKEENKDMSEQDAERLSRAIKNKSNIRE